MRGKLNQKDKGEDVSDVLDLLTQIAGLIFEAENPLRHATEIVRQIALSHKADISTLFVVEEGSTLVLKAGVASLRGEEIELPTNSYELDWSAKSEQDMENKGLTAFVAVSGEALSVESYEELVEKHPAHRGVWDQIIYPYGIRDPETGFGCFYGVPLRRSTKGHLRDTIIGVFKIERRMSKPKFTKEDHRVFDLVAAHLSLVLQASYRVQNRVFSDVTHAISGGLARTLLALDMCYAVANERERNIDEAFQYIEKNLPKAMGLLDKACRRLNAVLDASRDPDRMTEETLGRMWESIVSDVELKADRNIQESNVELDIQQPLTLNTKIRLRSMEFYDLSSILGNLLENAIRYARTGGPITVEFKVIVTAGKRQLAFRVADHGGGIPEDILRQVSDTHYNEIYRLPGTSGAKGTGLRRVFGLANLNDWKVKWEIENGSEFEVRTPDFRSSV
jgi:anti-sigma regulatory factor (Ser/Thr protein kinase)